MSVLDYTINRRCDVRIYCQDVEWCTALLNWNLRGLDIGFSSATVPTHTSCLSILVHSGDSEGFQK